MKVNAVRIQGWKSFADTGVIELANVNVLVGRNNSGKSAFIRAIHQIQEGGDALSSDIRIGESKSDVIVGLTGINLAKDTTRYFDKQVSEHDNLQLNIRLSRATQGGGIHAPYTRTMSEVETNWSPPLIPAREPNNFIYTYFSKRKVAAFDPQIDEARTLTVSGDLRNLASKVLRLANPTYPGYEEYTRLCREVLGFQVTTYASDNGQKAGIPVGRYDHIPLEAMGEGVASQLGLIVDLCMADGNLYLIEEPENDVHPEGLKTLLRVIGEKSKDNQFIITTHSNVVVKNLGADSRLFNIELDFKPNEVPTSTITRVENTPHDRIAVLRQLGYELYDSDMYEGWLILEESSAQVIIRNYLIPWFVPRLARIQTVAAGGVGKVEPAFEDFRRLFLFAHLEEHYQRRAWVVVDGDKSGNEVVEKLRNAYGGWPANHFHTWSEPDFERYYPAHFADRVSKVLALSHNKKRQPKKELLEEVKAWCDSHKEEAQAAFKESAQEVIDYLKKIDNSLFGTS
jgi:predicted ATPase